MANVVRPVSSDYVVTQAFGHKLGPGYGAFSGKYHSGVDYSKANCYGDIFWACADGTVVFTGHVGYGWGEYTVIKHKQWLSRYGHWSKSLVEVGQRVKKGDHIGHIGNGDGRYGPHLHWDISRLDFEHDLVYDTQNASSYWSDKDEMKKVYINPAHILGLI